MENAKDFSHVGVIMDGFKNILLFIFVRASTLFIGKIKKVKYKFINYLKKIKKSGKKVGNLLGQRSNHMSNV